ncbi:hypothetical protein HPP92_005711 [Vanilla planifolia]|uniref:Aminotransferase class V domain-containing protein n=1 Tax=Vanilla planifolia TaxID=51239 RepID=A0A835RKS3_VANPL|nr:hypothetical protein HPP92_005711 [Vanilla planifolia]
MKLNKLFGIIGSVHVPSSLIAAQAGTDGGSPAEKRLEWLRSQLIGRDLQFDTCFGKRLLTYADHTASGRCLRYIEEYITQQVLPFYDHQNGPRGEGIHKEVRWGLPRGCSHLCGSGATAAIKRLQEVMGIAVPANLRSQVIENLREEERWVVFVGPFEHHSNLLSWRQSIAEVVEIGIDADGLVDMEALELQLASMKYSNRPKLGSFSACSNVTGIIADTRALSRLLHKYGAYACFDFATSGPYVEIDMRSREEEGYDAIFLSPHKFPGGPGSPGILVMHEALYLAGSFPPLPVEVVSLLMLMDSMPRKQVGYEPIDLHETIYMKMVMERSLKPPVDPSSWKSKSKEAELILSFLVFSRDKLLHGGLAKTAKPSIRNPVGGGSSGCPYGHRLLGVEESSPSHSAIEKES